MANIDTAVRRINNLLGPENQKRISAFLENTEKSAAVISGVLEAKRENLANAITNIEKAANDFGAVTENLRRITGDLSGLTAKLDASAGDALDNLNKRFSDEEMGKVLRNLESFHRDRLLQPEEDRDPGRRPAGRPALDRGGHEHGHRQPVQAVARPGGGSDHVPAQPQGEEVMRKAALLILLTAGLWGCFSASPDKTYFQLHLEAERRPRTCPSTRPCSSTASRSTSCTTTSGSSTG